MTLDARHEHGSSRATMPAAALPPAARDLDCIRLLFATSSLATARSKTAGTCHSIARDHASRRRAVPSRLDIAAKCRARGAASCRSGQSVTASADRVSSCAGGDALNARGSLSWSARCSSIVNVKRVTVLRVRRACPAAPRTSAQRCRRCRHLCRPLRHRRRERGRTANDGG